MIVTIIALLILEAVVIIPCLTLSSRECLRAAESYGKLKIKKGE